MTNRVIVASLAVAGAAMMWLALRLPPHGFYAGDSGVKLIAARNVLAHPSRPLQVDLPAIEGKPVPYVERFFVVHEQHAHALQSPVFPMLSAPFIAIFGLRGAYVLPLVSFLAVLPLVNVARERVTPDVRVGWVVAFATIASPAFFYALEYWEHMPAIACLAAATAFTFAGPDARWAPYVTGIASGLAMLLRPEAMWYALALCWLAWQRRALSRVMLGLAVVLVPFAIANWLDSGNVAGAHVAANLAPITHNWLEARVDRGVLWFIPGSPIGTAGVAAFAAIGAAILFGLEVRRAQFLALSVAAILAVASAAGTFARDSLWHAWPAAFLLLVPMSTVRCRRLLVLALIPIAAIWLSSTHDGGAQWGPRFVLICTPALTLLAAAACSDAAGKGYARRARHILLLVILLACVWTTRAAYRELRGTKKIYAQMVDTFETHVRPGAYVVSNLWWFDQVTAALYGTRTFLFADDQAASTQILQELRAASVPVVALVWSRDPSEGESLVPAVDGTCYRFVTVKTIPERSLSLGTLSCAMPPNQ